jgi:hypothetical protein
LQGPLLTEDVTYSTPLSALAPGTLAAIGTVVDSIGLSRAQLVPDTTLGAVLGSFGQQYNIRPLRLGGRIL